MYGLTGAPYGISFNDVVKDDPNKMFESRQNFFIIR